ncbi:MAG: hypothetical protein M5U14_17640 [Acidimicrobiia bacterium]|nr:hypothetical protein [Acidimicrobiia bacterium]
MRCPACAAFLDPGTTSCWRCHVGVVAPADPVPGPHRGASLPLPRPAPPPQPSWADLLDPAHAPAPWSARTGHRWRAGRVVLVVVGALVGLALLGLLGLGLYATVTDASGEARRGGYAPGEVSVPFESVRGLKGWRERQRAGDDPRSSSP